MLHKELTEVIIKSFYKVYNTMGYGFLEKVYENALAKEIKKAGLDCVQQKQIKVYYEQEEVGIYYADLLVAETIVIETKAAQSLCEEHECQLVNYLKATELEVGVLLNFGKDPKFVRKIYTNDRKNGIRIYTDWTIKRQTPPIEY